MRRAQQRIMVILVMVSCSESWGRILRLRAARYAQDEGSFPSASPLVLSEVEGHSNHSISLTSRRIILEAEIDLPHLRVVLELARRAFEDGATGLQHIGVVGDLERVRYRLLGE